MLTSVPLRLFLTVSCVFVGFTSLLAEPAYGQGRLHDQMAPGDFLVEYRRTLHQLEVTYANARVEGSSQTIFSPLSSGEKVPRNRESGFVYTRYNDNERLDLVNSKPKYLDRALVGQGMQRYFVVRRSSADGAYFLEKLSDKEVPHWKAVFQDFRVGVKDAAYSPPECIYPPTYPTYPSLVDSPDFNVRHVTRLIEGGKHLVKVDFQFRSSLPPLKPQIDGWLLLDPAMNWVIRQFDFNRRNTNQTPKGVVQYTIHLMGSVSYKENSGVATPNEITLAEILPTQKVSHAYNISNYDFKTPDSNDFTLASFGLGDIDRSLDKARQLRMYWSFIYTAAALVAFTISFMLFRIGRRRHKEQLRRAADATAAGNRDAARSAGETSES